MQNLIEVVVADKSLAMLMKGFKAAQIVAELNQKGPYTLFAPTDLAFGNLPGGELAELMKPENKVKLKDILDSHIVLGKNNYEDLVNGQTLKSINGKNLFVVIKAGVVSINGSNIQRRDMHASNGIVHSLDKVIESRR